MKMSTQCASKEISVARKFLFFRSRPICIQKFLITFYFHLTAYWDYSKEMKSFWNCRMYCVLTGRLQEIQSR